MTDPRAETGAPAVAAAVSEASEAGPPPSDRDLADLPRNDYGNGRRLIARHGDDLRVVAELHRDAQDGWLVWTGGAWSGEEGWPEAQKRAHETAEAIGQEAMALEDEGPPEPNGGETDAAYKARVKAWEKRVEAHHKWAVGSGNAPKVGAMLKSAAPYLRVRRSRLDANPLLLACRNGTLDLSGDLAKLRTPARDDLISRVATAEFDPEADAPRFRDFLERVLPDREVRTFVQRFFGYALTGYTGEQRLVLFWGRGANGKSTLLNILRGVTGDYAITLPFASLAHDPFKRGGEATPDLVRLPGARLVTASEPEVGTTLSEGLIKEQTGGEPVTVRPLYGTPFEFLPTHKLVLSFNNKPKVKATDRGTWRRLAMVPFSVTIPEAERDDRFAERVLREEAAGILNWLIDGFYLWRERGLDVPDAVRGATEDYRGESDPLADFIAACTREPMAGEGRAVRASALYKAYERWCKENAVEPISQTRFGRTLVEREEIAKEKVGGHVYYHGLRLREETQGMGAGAGEPPPPCGPEDY